MVVFLADVRNDDMVPVCNFFYLAADCSSGGFGWGSEVHTTLKDALHFALVLLSSFCDHVL
jgi:hypothetical protein